MNWRPMIVVGQNAFGAMVTDNTSLMVVEAADKDWFASFQRRGEETVYLQYSYETAEDAMHAVLRRIVT